MSYKLNAYTADDAAAATLMKGLSDATDDDVHLWPVSLMEDDVAGNEEFMKAISQHEQRRQIGKFPHLLNISYPLMTLYQKTLNISFVFDANIDALFKLVALLKHLGVKFVIVDDDSAVGYGSMI